MKEIQLQEICEKVKESGVVLVNDFLNSEQFELANNILKNVYNNQYKRGYGSRYFPVSLKNIIVKLLKFEFGELKNSFLLKKIAKDLQLKKIAEKIFEHEAELYMLDCCYSKKSNEHILPWHNDIGYMVNDNFYAESDSTVMKKDHFYGVSASTINLIKTKKELIIIFLCINIKI